VVFDIEEPRGETMQLLLLAALSRTDRILLMGSSSLRLTDPPWTTALARLASHVVSKSVTTAWPGTINGPTTAAFELTYSKKVAEALTELVSNWFELSGPNGLLEDICFVRDEKPWLVTVTHERLVWLEMTAEEVLALQEEVSGLKIQHNEALVDEAIHFDEPAAYGERQALHELELAKHHRSQGRPRRRWGPRG
jgi:hypothetical protein